MAKRGAPKKAIRGDAKVVKHDFGNKRRAEAQPTGEAPSLRDGLCPLGQKIWDDTIENLKEGCGLRRCDEASLYAYCNAYARLIKAQKVLNEEGMTYTTFTKQGEMIRQRPEVGIVEKAEKIVRAFATEFGMTTAARKNIGDQNQGRLPLNDPTQGYA